MRTREIILYKFLCYREDTVVLFAVERRPVQGDGEPSPCIAA